MTSVPVATRTFDGVWARTAAGTSNRRRCTIRYFICVYLQFEHRPWAVLSAMDNGWNLAEFFLCVQPDGKIEVED
jgi:hypothetical protein